jgi:hypothetical protein
VQWLQSLWPASLALALACAFEGPPTYDQSACWRARKAMETQVRDSAFDTRTALADLRARGDTLVQSFVVVYAEGPTEADLARFLSWHAYAFYPRPGEPWLQVAINVTRAELVAANARVDRVVPGELDVPCPGI